MSSPPALRSSPAAQLLPPWRPRRRRLVLSMSARASRPSCDLAPGASARYGPHPQPLPLPRLVAAESSPSTSLAAVGAIQRDAETGLSLLLVVLGVVMSFFLSLAILSFSASRALQKMETAANKLAKLFAEEVPGTLSSLNLSFMEINDLTSQLKNLRKRLAISRFGKNPNSKASSSSW
ncbi:hypothetical protein BDA96_09G037300 [Sorghum bicolor]|uniref:Uncharacterized protein n=2 Tax=Sorghum bicolor TaxID=4558 RepID=A0A1B6P6B4_SORBI|nr:uncharacterized protein LOC8068199 [Sorghum bicolor]XP_021303707.1 uncharacterized protein LOC8068199 [Sorghum bicolor]XP_021303708.1 uncharacterized protein LOC8068199 [Sorghum bicolor]KAG0516846.1 hypothetical protein BDA96_09G037300 [Sorghum bicolor]KXG21249.1 hypothetical protein SORBI_3009G035000 [Sorghum bicolor]KXG21250.1 hypothetical protein SORBI_3009G035000 [Sorghum bicolor]|eukprot:XP_002439242.2 uncharacterized protein LOC8068199 [Sorghum bicolor]